MKTTYYFLETNAYNEVIATDGTKGISLTADSQGKYMGIDLYQTNDDDRLDRNEIVAQLKAVFADAEGLYTMSDFERENEENLFDLEGLTDCEMTEIITVE